MLDELLKNKVSSSCSCDINDAYPFCYSTLYVLPRAPPFGILRHGTGWSLSDAGSALAEEGQCMRLTQPNLLIWVRTPTSHTGLMWLRQSCRLDSRWGHCTSQFG